MCICIYIYTRIYNCFDVAVIMSLSKLVTKEVLEVNVSEGPFT